MSTNKNFLKNRINDIKEEILFSRQKQLFISYIIFALIIIIMLIVFFSYLKNFGEITLKSNKKDIFSINDLIINNLKYGDYEKDVIKELGKAKSIKKETINNYEYKILSYDGLKIYLKEYYEDYKLSKVEITSKKYYVSRKIRVGKKITNVFKKYRVDNKNGAYIYGNYTNKSLYEKDIDGNIYYGVRSNENILFINRDSKVDNLPTNIAILNIEYKKGIIRKITWSYDID